ncbi:hypothetical protein HDU76_004876 [Blyttiomyces sp. JEL0837]|nr:hypothetical protein HDU76_004876 [Blyttiomyces sp. JEL0837]
MRSTDRMVQLISSFIIILTTLIPAIQSYCSNSEPTILSGPHGTISDGSPPFQPSRPGSDCTWLIYADAGTITTIEVSDWELNPNSNDRISISWIDSHGDEFPLTNVTGYWMGKPMTVIVGDNLNENGTNVPGMTVTSNLVSMEIGPTVDYSVKVRFLTDSQSPQFDGLFISWWKGPVRVAGCPNDCFSAYGRGTCAPDGITCICAPGYSSADCHNDDVNSLINFYNSCGGKSWFQSSNWNPSNPPCPLTSNSSQRSQPWFGIGGNCVAGRVTGLSLPGNNIDCRTNIPTNSTLPTVPKLPLYIRSLDLSRNALWSFPTWISSMNQLNSLTLARAMMDGVLPDELATSPTLPLISFNISKNTLRGGFLNEKAVWLSNLLLLDISSNQFEGLLPSSIGAMKVSGAVKVDGNRFL